MPIKKEIVESERSVSSPKPRGRAGVKKNTEGIKAVPDRPVARRAVRKKKGEEEGASRLSEVDFVLPVKSRDPLTHEQIAVRAYYIAEQWRAEGKDMSDEGVWLEAERQMRAEQVGCG